MKRTMVDTGTTIVFFTIVAAISEYFIAGMEPREVLLTRAIMVPLMILTGRPYGIWRDWVFTKTLPSRAVTRVLADAGAFISFQLPVYAATLVVAGADIREITILMVAVVPQMLLVSRPFGVCLDLMRRLAGLDQPGRGPQTGTSAP